MSRFLNETMSDIRSGRQSWRVVISMSVPAFLLSIAAAIAQHPL